MFWRRNTTPKNLLRLLQDEDCGTSMQATWVLKKVFIRTQ